MKMGVPAAGLGGLIIGAAAMVPLGSFAQSETPKLPPLSNTQELATTDPQVESPNGTETPAPTPPVTITPPSFGPGDKTDKDDNDVEYGDGSKSDDGDRDHHAGDREDDHEVEQDDD